MTDASIATADPDVSISFLDVGQGDCTLVVAHSARESLLIDCHSAGREQVRALLDDAGVALTSAVITHFHLDHYGAVGALLNEYPGASVRFNPPASMPADRDEMKKVRAVLRTLAAAARRPGSRQIATGDVGSVGGVHWICHAPNLSLAAIASAESDQNKTSVVMTIRVDGLSVLISGDADAEVWGQIIDAVGPVDVLRVSHHGAPLNGAKMSESSILESLRPGLSIISVGTSNRYGHPSLAWIDALRAKGSRIMCTEVTALCHQLEPRQLGRVPCAGAVGIKWWQSGEWEVGPTAAQHQRVIDAWSTPRCR